MNTQIKDPPPKLLQPFAPTPAESLEKCDAVMVALGDRRVAIIRRDDTQRRMFPTERICKRIRDLQPGDEVVYDGRRETVRSICAY